MPMPEKIRPAPSVQKLHVSFIGCGQSRGSWRLSKRDQHRNANSHQGRMGKAMLKAYADSYQAV